MARTKRKNRADAAPMTTAQMLGSLLKSARDLMRKDKGLNGDLDRLPLLTWIMFLKFLDDLERQREDEAKAGSKKFKPAVEPPYRWRDWAENSQGITGDELLAFINNDEAMRPDGTKGPGLFAYLRGLSSSNGDNRRDVIATVFKGVDNRMKSGYLLRDVINKIAGIRFTSSDELHTLGALYESMLREMRDAAGDSGEFYTPRAVVRFMVEVTDPRLGEVVLDPASGTGGFLVEAYSHLEKQVKTVADRKRLQGETIFGCEPKSLPYLLCQMNLLLHGLDAPQIDPDNALRFKLSEIGERDRVDVILTNPPFGGEEEKGIQAISRMTAKPQRRRCCSFSSSCASSSANRLPSGDPRAPPSSCRTARSLATASAPASRRSCSRISTCTPSYGCRTASLRRIPASRRTFCSSTARGRRRKSGTMSSPCLKGARITRKPSPCSSTSFAAAWSGGKNARKTIRLGKCRSQSCWRPVATSTARTRAARWTSSTCRPISLRTIFCKKSCASPN